jgi:hypothetical protein
MAFSSGAYFGSHSTVSQGLAWRAARDALLRWMEPLSMTRTTGVAFWFGRGAQRSSSRLSSAMKSALRLVRLVVTIRSLSAKSSAPIMATLRAWPGASMRSSTPRLARRFDAQLDAAPGPGVGEIGMRQRFRLVGEQQNDIAGVRLLLQQTQPQAGAIDGIGVLAPFQRVPRSPPAKAPFLRITTLSRDFEIRSPVRVSISSCSRGSVQLGRSAIGADSTAETTESAARAFTGSGPGALRARRPETPLQPNVQRQWRTLSGLTANASAIRKLDHPASDSKSARARSASSRSDERARACSSSRSSVVASTRGRPAMAPPEIQQTQFKS